MISVAAVHLLVFLCHCILLCLCHWFPSKVVRFNSHPFSVQLGRHIGQQSQHFQNLMWHVFHESKINSFIHITTILLDTLLWILFACVYLPSWMQAMLVFFLIIQTLSKNFIFPRSIAGNPEVGLKNEDITSNTTVKCIHCDSEHSYPSGFWDIYLWIKMQWARRLDTRLLRIDWIKYDISLCTSLFWVFLVFMTRYLLKNNYIYDSHLPILHIAILINALLRALGHIPEQLPPFMFGHEHFLDDRDFSFRKQFLRQNLIYHSIKLLFVSFISEYQAGQIVALPEVCLYALFARILRPTEEILAKEHYLHQANMIRLKGWKSTVLTNAMYKPFFKTH